MVIDKNDSDECKARIDKEGDYTLFTFEKSADSEIDSIYFALKLHKDNKLVPIYIRFAEAINNPVDEIVDTLSFLDPNIYYYTTLHMRRLYFYYGQQKISDLKPFTQPYKLLAFLYFNPDKFFTRTTLEEVIWEGDHDKGEFRSVYNQIGSRSLKV